MQEIRRIHLNFCTPSFLIHQFTLNRLHSIPKQNSQQVFLEILNFSLRCCCVCFLDSSLVNLLNDRWLKQLEMFPISTNLSA